MTLDAWDVVGDAEMTEHWRSVVPVISVEPVGGHGDVANDRGRASRVRQRYVLELKHPTQTERSRGFVSSSLTRISDWSPLTDEERRTTRPRSPFALCRGTPSGLSPEVARGSDDSLDFAFSCRFHHPSCPPDDCSSTESLWSFAAFARFAHSRGTPTSSGPASNQFRPTGSSPPDPRIPEARDGKN